MKKNTNPTSAIVKVRKFISISACFCMIASNAVLLPAGTYEQPYHRTPCDDGSCAPKRSTMGFHQTTWREWPEQRAQPSSLSKPNVRQPHGVPRYENPPPKKELDHPAPLPSRQQDSGEGGAQPAPGEQPSQPSQPSPSNPLTPPGQRDNVPNFKVPPKDPTDFGGALGAPTISMSYNKDVPDPNNIPTDQSPPRDQDSGLKLLPENRFNEPASKPIRRLPSNPQFQNDRSDVEKLLDNGPRFRNATDPQSSITPEDLEQNDRPEIIQGETVRINMNNARTVLNIQEPKNEPNRIASRESTPSFSTTIQRTSANSPNMTPRISVPNTNVQPIQRADFNSTGNDTAVTSLGHSTPVMIETKSASKETDLMKEYQNATLKIVQSPSSNPSATAMPMSTATSSVQFAPARTVSYQSNSAPAPLTTFDAGPMISAPAINAPASAASAIKVAPQSSAPSNPLRGVPTGNPLRRN